LLLTDNKNKFCDQFLKIMEPTEKNITVNRRAQHEYFILQSYEAGIALVGTEVKALRQNKGNLVDSYATITNGEVWLYNTNISTYDQGSINNHDPIRKRKLLLKKTEIRKLNKAVTEKGNTLIPLRMYFKNGLVKVELAIATGKRQYDKRESIAKRDMNREMLRKFK
jgi:SsrA-binding protein